MCGFAGLIDYSVTQTLETARNKFAGVSRDVFSRGPNGNVFVADEHMSSLHARLPIVGGLEAEQPLVNEQKNRYALFVGEVYNWKNLSLELSSHHSFNSASDGEVLLHGYEEEGLRFFRKVDGMFALALRDLERSELILIRDRMGIKPLFWGQNGDRTAFATDIKTVYRLLGRKPEFDWQHALQRMGQPSRYPGTCWKFVQEVEPGTAIIIRKHEAPVIHKWHDFSYNPSNISKSTFEESYKHALVESVHSQTQDVEKLCIALSGGLDSSVITALSQAPLSAFTLVNDSTIGNGELDAARVVAQHLQLPLHEITPRPASSELTQEYLDLLRHYENPDVRSEHLLKNELAFAAAQQGFKVILSGQGSDEFNGGYSGLLTEEGEVSGLEKYLKESIEEDYYGQILFRNGIRQDMAMFLNWRNISSFLTEEKTSDHLWEQELHRRLTMLRRYNLTLEDRVTSRFGLENRVPFLGNDLVDLSWKIPESIQRELLSNKEVLRTASNGLLPEQIIRREKIPFFHGAHSGATFRYLSEVLLHEDDSGESLYSLARQSHALQGGPLDADKFDQLASLLMHYPEHEAVEALGFLINVALLSETEFFESHETFVMPERLFWFQETTLITK